MGAGSLDCGGFLNSQFLLLMCKILCRQSFTKIGFYGILIFDQMYFFILFFSVESISSLTGVGHLISEMSFARPSVGVHYTVRREI